MDDKKTYCYHCGEVVLTGNTYQLTILGEKKTLCCNGCLAVAKLIVVNDLTSYYQYRTTPAIKSELLPSELDALLLYDDKDVQKEFVFQKKDHNEIILAVENISCAACVWLLEKHLYHLDGVIKVNINSSTNRAMITWDRHKIRLSQILREIQKIGYKALPFEVEKQEQYYQSLIKVYYYRLGVSGLACMQVSMLAIAMYFFQLDDGYQHYFRWISLIFSTPILLYSAFPFYVNAWRGIKTRHINMDISVSLALLFAYFSSCYATFIEKGDVYFESITMFTFFLLLGRLLEIKAKYKTSVETSNLVKLTPKIAKVKNQQGEYLNTPINQLKINDIVLVLTGETIPCDGEIVSGESLINESALNGEFLPIKKQIGDEVLAGTINTENNLKIKVTKEINNYFINQIVQLQHSAQATKPKLIDVTDKIGNYFVLFVLIASAFTWFFWSQIQHSEDAFWIMLSVLVATCPCALSLATPTAFTCAISALSKKSVLISDGDQLEKLTKVTHVFFDKTGTLTEGNMRILAQTCYKTDVKINFDSITSRIKAKSDEKNTILLIAKALESYSNHPIASAFSKELKSYHVTNSVFSKVENITGQGILASLHDLNGQEQVWRIGKKEFVVNKTSSAPGDLNVEHQVFLSCNGHILASFQLEDPIRKSSFSLINGLRQQKNIQVTMLTGDNFASAYRVADQLGITDVRAGLLPEQKLAILREQPNYSNCLMIGDGVNDSPALAGASLSATLCNGSDLAKLSADIIILNDDLLNLLHAQSIAKKTHHIINQNLYFSLAYNVAILPLAMMGFITPYLAVIGMSFSSLFVVSNSLRILGK